nr:Rap1a/Tai family immunity protein [Methylobacterium sp. L1A1]
MRIAVVTMVALLCVGLPCAGGAQEAQQEVPQAMRGATLVEDCRNERPECGAYLQGVADRMVSDSQVCDPPRFDRQQLRQAYLGWAETDTYLRDKHMLAGAERALKRAWPCRPQ